MHFQFVCDRQFDAQYVKFQLSQLQFLKAKKYKPVWPRTLVTRIAAGENYFTDEDIAAAIDDDHTSSNDCAEAEASFRALEPRLNLTFLDQLQDGPAKVIINVTKFGPGGSYHPGNPARVTVRYPPTRVSFSQTVVHEVIELSIHQRASMERHKVGAEAHDIKEAVVDRFCSCNELIGIYGSYKIQEQFAQKLPDDWEDWLDLRAGASRFTWPNCSGPQTR